MFVLANFLYAVAKLADVVLTMMTWLIIIRALISWVNPDPYNPIVQIIQRLTDPVIHPFRKLIPMQNLGIDLSPMIAILAIWFTQLFLVQSLYGIALQLR